MHSEVQEKNLAGYTETLIKHLFVLAGYTETLINVLVREYEEDQTSLKNSIQDLRENMPPPLIASFVRNPAKKQQLNSLSRDLHIYD